MLTSFKHRTHQASVLAICLIVGLATPSLAENWPQWRGPTGLSLSSETNLPIEWSESNHITAKIPLPISGSSTPAVWNDSIFVTVEDEGILQLIKIDRATNDIAWSLKVGEGTANRKQEGGSSRSPKYHNLHNMASPSPITDGEIVVVHFGNGDLAAYDFEGEQLWKLNLPEDYGNYSIWWGHANSPILYEDLVISVCIQDSLADIQDEPVESYIVAHDRLTGKEVWYTPRMTEANAEECDAYTTPIIRSTPSGDQLVVMGGNQLDAYDPHTGEQKWKLPGLVGGRTITGPTLADGLVYATVGMRGEIKAVRPEKLDEGIDAAVVWSYRNNTPDTCCPVVIDKLLFMVSDNGIASCLNSQTGELHWRERLGGDFKASPVYADGHIYFLNKAGECTVVDAAAEFRKISVNQLDDEFIASPAISDGQILVRGKQALYVIESKP
ncbi:outer membrane protein assembly factor BamB family protein [Polystyrenella longa]|nr:PQQ-binding-like beta-propeller repeat protein [Polystyrenella longa]